MTAITYRTILKKSIRQLDKELFYEKDVATRQILQGTEKADKNYTFHDDKHDPNKPAQWWFQESDEGLILFIVFYSQACRWALSGL
ncbi:MAG: hypothetical protein V8K32_11130 [Candidatus Electrothrix gigas]